MWRMIWDVCTCVYHYTQEQGFFFNEWNGMENICQEYIHQFSFSFVGKKNYFEREEKTPQPPMNGWGAEEKFSLGVSPTHPQQQQEKTWYLTDLLFTVLSFFSFFYYLPVMI